MDTDVLYAPGEALLKKIRKLRWVPRMCLGPLLIDRLTELNWPNDEHVTRGS
jgi:hypothetical protein